MQIPEITSDRMVGLFLLGALAFNAPILSIFNADSFVFGIPVLYVYLFAAWTTMIVLMALTAQRSHRARRPPPPRHGPAADGEEA